MQITTTSVYERNAEAWLNRKNGIRRAGNEGGTYSSKTYSILQLLILIAQHAKRKLKISIVSESLPHLKRGCIYDFKNILDDAFEDSRYNKTEQTYDFGNGSVEFFGADEAGKVKGPRREILYINEANNVPWETARGLDTRTALFTFLDWNPTHSFWVHEYESGGKVVPGWITDPDFVHIHSTYRDAINVIPADKVRDIESYRDKDPNWWNIYGLGLAGKIEGLVYPYFKQVKTLPIGDTHYWLDFGFTTDVTAFGRSVIIDKNLYSQELIYQKNLTNQDIAVRMTELGVSKSDEIFADSAEPKSIEEIYRLGFNIKPAAKGPGSVEYGHQLIRQYNQFWTEDSLNCIKEQRNFMYIRDKNGKLTDKTTHAWSHGMDGRRYGLVGKLETNSFSAWDKALTNMINKQVEV
ncbi:MAG TPA: terminase large subunit [Dehalococcoidales bacterium]|nr:terminase large subunit [Dehalococcoidales bacterium]